MPATPAASKTDALDFLADASGRLASTFDLSATLPQVADLCVREIADYCAIYARRGDGSFALVEACNETGFHAYPADQRALAQVLRAQGFESVVTAPLVGHHEALGYFVLAARERSALNGRAQKLANVLSLQIAGALDHALLFERTHRVADRLQRALLPDTFPRIPGALFHAAYRPASDEAEVGGDWYDAFLLPDGRVAISMGDVAGHGLEAATVMGEIRQAMRTTAVSLASPSALLERVNAIINLRSNIGMVTAIFGFYEPQMRELTYAVAGHPPPILTIEDGFSGLLPGGGVPLGITERLETRDWTFTLPPRSCAIFYTDGLTEYKRDIIAGEQRLLEAGIHAFQADPENPAMALQERIFDQGANRDDAATLTLTCADGPAPHAMLFSAVPISAPIVRAAIHRLCDDYGLDSTERFSLITAVGEAVANAVEHAYRGEAPGVLRVRVQTDAKTLTLEIEDYGRWRPFQKRDERGRGIALMHELMDRVRIMSEQNRTVITLMMERERQPAIS